MTDNNLFKSDSFSFNRVGALFAYYFPTLRKQLIVYLGISILFSGLLLIPGSDEVRTGFFSFIWTVLYWMWFLAPVSLTGKGRTGTVDRLLPTKASEKLVFMLLWFVVIIPLSLVALPQSVERLLYSSLGDEYPHLRNAIRLQLYSSWTITCINILSNICASLACLFGVLKARYNKMLFAILSAIVVQIILGIIGAFYGGYEAARKAFAKGYEDGLAGKEAAYDCDPLQLTEEILQPSPVTFIVLGLILGSIITFVVLIYRRLRKPSI